MSTFAMLEDKLRVESDGECCEFNFEGYLVECVKGKCSKQNEKVSPNDNFGPVDNLKLDRDDIKQVIKCENDGVAIVYKDDALKYFVGTEFVWEMNGFLNFPQKISIVNFPKEPNVIEDEVQPESFIENYFERLKSMFKIENLIETDKFGFRKMIVVLTRQGYLIGVDSLTGEVLWQSKEKFKDFYLSKVHIHPEVHAITLDNTLFRFNLLNGSQEALSSVSYSSIINTNRETKDHHKIHGFINDDKVWFSENYMMTPVNYFELKGKSLIGNVIVNSTVNQKWENIYPNSIIKSTKRENVAEILQGKVLGDRTTLFKYTNPNMIAVLTKGNLNDDHTVSIVDTKWGRILTRINIKDSKGPFHLNFLENKLIIIYSGVKSKRTHLVAVDFYDSCDSDKGYQQNYTIDSKICSFDLSFILPVDVKAVGHTNTLQGISTRHFLVLSENGDLFSISKNVLDARRPLHKPNHLESEEGLFQYAPLIKLEEKNIINKNSPIDANEIKSFPTDLESTTVILCTGRDFYMTTWSSQQFDRLSESFQKGLLLSALLALSVIAIIAQRSHKKKVFKNYWK
ncbi:DUF1620-domain-containing protein [Rozella allomycis CSF55]|uniref:ER membrane protein complex subunit 1 n=1 Tax=Rozella allomycis (strain CSF55) TaxID=988480 RepID=A0A4P9YI46_ROZAC|nr:DUF1620-domain-containing protein [Rozella allomycis CSF55]